MNKLSDQVNTSPYPILGVPLLKGLLAASGLMSPKKKYHVRLLFCCLYSLHLEVSLFFEH